ncbi:MAG: tRNA (N6-isopentenyl adenosine(37)-C2)-methylthiotransferase MiaB [Thermoguttaceae bacterium]|nr:tRNA (N6-isopentenyl adenosine(37)-C2)-methylthiotransferase MiaB [Thermoguttaceae bacterium]
MTTFYIETVGCQMNVLDSELVAGLLVQHGYTPAADPKKADILLFNTCSVRAHAEDKIYSALGRLKNVKDFYPERIYGVMGCMAQKDARQIVKRCPHVDLVVGPGKIAHIPDLIEKIRAGQTPQILISEDRRGKDQHEVAATFEQYDPQRIAGLDEVHSPDADPVPRFQAMLRIMLGCDNFCTYCIVPYVRGPQQSRPIGKILDEAKQLLDNGVKEIMLLGQRVNAYKYEENGKTYQLADVLYAMADLPGLERLRFVTGSPSHVDARLLETVRDIPIVCPHFHIPAQSGSNAMLKKMNRGYTVEQYREMVSAIYSIVPGSSITSDFIVGFCGETEEDFQQTADLVRWARFKNSYIFKYSPREGTVSAKSWPDDIPDEVKRRRNNELLAIQNEISLADNQKFVGKTVELLVEGPSKTALKLIASDEENQHIQMSGRTPCDRIGVFNGPESLAGQIVKIEVERASNFTLFGKLV